MELSFRVKKVMNGFLLSYDDPEIRMKNRTSDGPYIDPSVEVVFTDAAKLNETLTPLIQAMAEAPEEVHTETAFSSAFKEAIGD